MSESTKHDAIYLQVCDDEDSDWCGEITWCQDRIHDEDVKYIRADLVESLRQQLAKALAACKTKDELIEKFRRAIGDHCVPDHCYATGPLTGNECLDLVQCPACSAIAAYEEALERNGT